MHQIIFSDQSMGEIRKLKSAEVLLLIDHISTLATEMFKDEPPKDLPKVHRGKNAFYRAKVGTFRVYLAPQKGDVLFCHYIIPQHTLTDFIFRSNLPISDEQIVEQHSSFWKYIDSFKKK